MEWFNEEGELDLVRSSRGDEGVRMSWDQRFGYYIQEPRAEAGMEPVTEEERIAFKAMLQSMLAFRLRERATAQQVLHSEWMEGWGESAHEESWGARFLGR